MRMMDELKPLFLYSAKKKVYAPIDEKDRRHNSAILLLTPSLESSSKLMNLPYIFNPNLFTSFYIDRNVMAYIDNVDIDEIELDEKEEEAVSEAMLRNWNTKVKFKYDEDTSIMDKKYSEEVFNKNSIAKVNKTLRLSYIPETIKVFIHPNVSSLRNDAPSKIKSIYKDKLYSYSNNDELHIVSKRVYDPEIMGGPYDMYLMNELICNLIMQANPDLALIPTCAIAQVISGIFQWKKDHKNDNYDIDIGTDECNKFAKSINIILKNNKINIIHSYLRTGNISVFANYLIDYNMNSLKKIIFESEISYFDRQRLLPSEFGIPNKRKYPIHNEEHVRIAIRMFNNCDPSEEKELAQNILKKIENFGITDIKVSASNRFRPYYDEYIRKLKEKSNKSKENKLDSFYNTLKSKLGQTPDQKKVKPKSESVIAEGSLEDSDYADIMKICNHLSDKELRRITFYDTYRNSRFVIKRIIKRDGGTPVGFLDVYLFPSKPEIAQIVIAVSGEYRGMGIADDMVKELLNSDLHNIHNFDMYYWTAHPNNNASKNLALKNGFTDTNHMDTYGRNVFIKRVKDSEKITLDDLPYHLKPSTETEAIVTENAFVTSDMALISEAGAESQKLKKYLYQERIKNNKGVIELYEKIKATNPDIKKTYIKLEMYKKLNLYVDLSYYHSLFLKNNTFRLDRAVNFYFDFLNKLINNKDIDAEYSKKTIFIPIDNGTWSIAPNSDIFDYRKNLNPISIIIRLVRTNLAGLRKAWGDKDIIFVGTRGYFKVDFKNFELKNISRFKRNIDKLMSETEIIDDEYDIDDVSDGTLDDEVSTKKNANTTKALTAKMVDKIEKGTSIQIDNISNGETVTKETIPHLKLTDNNINLGSNVNNVAIISIDPDGPDGYEKISNTILANAGKINNYCIPK